MIDEIYPFTYSCTNWKTSIPMHPKGITCSEPNRLAVSTCDQASWLYPIKVSSAIHWLEHIT